MPVRIAQSVQERGPSGAPPFATMATLSALLRHRMPLAAQPFATYAWNGPRATRGWMSWSAARGGELPRQAPCRGWCLVTLGSLSLTGPCRDAGRVAASILSCLGRPSRQAPLAGALCFEQASRQAPLAGALFSSGGLPGKLLLPGSWLKYFVLGWPKKGPRRVLAIAWQVLPRGATTTRAQVRCTKVPLL